MLSYNNIFDVMKSDRPVRFEGSGSKVVEGPSHVGRYTISIVNRNIQADLRTGSSRHNVELIQRDTSCCVQLN